MKYRHQLLAGIVMVLGVPAAQAAIEKATLDLKQGSGTVEFHATGHPSALKIVGKGEKPEGNLILQGRAVSGEIRFQLESLDTGIAMRDRHMKEKYLEVQKYPVAKLVLNQVKLPQDLAEGATLDQVPFQGRLSLHGVEKPVSGTVQVSRKGTQISFSAQFGLKLADYAISVPTFAGITVADDVQVVVQETAQGAESAVPAAKKM